MSHRGLIISAVMAGLLVGACSSAEPASTSGPAPAAGPNADSIAEAQRREAERREREAELAAQRELEAATARARETLTEIVFFDYDVSEIRADAQAVLRRKVDVLRASPAVQLRIEGHADDRGSTEYNLALGSRRAEAVRQYFVNFGLNESRFDVRSYGEERALVRGADEQSWAQNRRDEFVITAGAGQITPPEDSQ